MPRSSPDDSDGNMSLHRKSRRRHSKSRRHHRDSRSRSRSYYRRDSVSRSRSRSYRRTKSGYRLRSPRDSQSRSRRNSVSRSRSRSCRRTKSNYRSRSHRDSPSHRTRSRKDRVGQTLAAIMSRLDAIEGSTAGTPRTPPRVQRNDSPRCSSDIPSAADTLVDALNVAMNKVKSHNYYVSNFDPAVHNFETWCDEVERAKLTNNWGDSETLSRVALCLKGDAKTWLNEWVTNDRSWSNFIKEFRSLCPHKLDCANILFEVMNTNSNKFNTYAEYARRSLLRLRIIKGLSEELMVQIVIRGINDAQVRAAAVNAELTMDNLVSFLSIYTKPAPYRPDNRTGSKPNISNKRNNAPSGNSCYSCGQTGHLRANCPKRRKPNEKSNTVTCAYCKKVGHAESSCYAKQRVEASNSNQRKVNLCKEVHDSPGTSDITTAVIQGIPVDVLIDSGALDVSLISSDVVKHFSCPRKSTYRTLKGIGNNGIVAREYVTLTVEFSKISLEIDFVVVPASYMNTPIIIGTDVLNRDGVTYIRTKHNQFLAHASNSICTITTVEPVKESDINTPLQGEELCQLIEMINYFKPFFISGTATTTVTTSKMQINLTSDVPVAYHPYRLSHQEKLKVREIINDLLHKNIIRESKSEYASPIILVKKRDGADRMCVDFRALNRITVKDRYPLPLIEDHIDRLGCSKFFTGLDMASGFHQIMIDEASVHKTGFVTPEGHYEYLKMPFGLCNSPTVYQRIINKTLQSFIQAGQVLVYIDDVLIMSMTVGEGIDLLREVLRTLTEAGFSINLRKCTFLTTEVEYLGRVISHGQVRPSPRKIEALINALLPLHSSR